MQPDTGQQDLAVNKARTEVEKRCGPAPSDRSGHRERNGPTLESWIGKQPVSQPEPPVADYQYAPRHHAARCEMSFGSRRRASLRVSALRLDAPGQDGIESAAAAASCSRWRIAPPIPMDNAAFGRPSARSWPAGLPSSASPDNRSAMSSATW